MASLSAAILARPPPQTAADPSPLAVAAAVHQHQQQQQQQQQQQHQRDQNQSSPSPSITPPNQSSGHRPHPHHLINSESLRDHLFLPSSSGGAGGSSGSSGAPAAAAAAASTPRSRLSSPLRELESELSSHGHGHGHHSSVDDAQEPHLEPSSPTSRSNGASAAADEKNRRRLNKLRYRSKSSVEQAPFPSPFPFPFPPIASLAGFGFPPSSSSAAAPNAMDPPVLSFYGAEPVPLPSRFAHIKRRLAEGHHDAIKASWARLLDALAADVRRIADQGPALIPSIDFAAIDDPAAVQPFQDALKTCGVGVVRGVVPARDTAAWVDETRQYLQPADTDGSTYDIKPPPPQDPTCFDFFWTPAQVRARAHPNVLRAMKFAMGFWAAAPSPSPSPTPDKDKAAADKSARGPSGDPRVATRFPISYADRIRIHVDVEQVNLVHKPEKEKDKENKAKAEATADGDKGEEATDEDETTDKAAAPHAVPAKAPVTPPTVMAQVDGGSLERWEPDGYGRGGTYDSVFRGRWEDYDPWDPVGRVQATPDLYNGAGACSIFRMFQGLLALTDVTPGMVRLLPSPKLATAYFLLRPFFKPKTAAPKGADKDDAAWAAFLDAANWDMEEEASTIIHGAVPGHAQRVTELWHPHLQLRQSLLTPPSLQAGDYIVWHCDTPYTITSEGGGPLGESGSGSDVGAPPGASLATAPMLVYVPACPLTQTNALYLARQRKAFLRGHPGPDFDATGSGLGSEADHAARLGETAIEAVGGREGLRAMGLLPWDVEKPAAAAEGSNVDTDVVASTEAAEAADQMDVEPPAATSAPSTDESLSQAELELVRLANIILFPDQYEFYMPTRHNSPDRE
ncbi:uncharacterized protein SPSK_01470 [Sporothrix schenckii 1099-18]|uniref:DUF1479 domain protein n=1 Tax=Sporothrix schenckii 1099-18 TaxID=1397361 RepID=A0A0F2MD00_SPOSC|nr:uncharacterized protein SPSK_01470 [Sporothrix schenckii 1099-18]KJR87522.1 hypothetical protein SPSK_01470 [Sporothrix schenckii 1099-18]